MTVTSVDKDVGFTLTLTVVADFDVAIGRVWRYRSTRDCWNAGGDRRATRRPCRSTT